MFPPQFYFIVNVSIILIRNINLMLKFTSYPQKNVDKFKIGYL